ncbi:decarboxylating 6-phosphogluconate dehydrogenase [candidate division WWE3 bacterium]|uniref:Decarboxylating 6-phosphogluconate dehydrogenase n=1 Tax=candidate division WWE3 bacterium TaxID=2053526 RepID=A0A955LG55_UNCKA|nr:decarboxylating 6-phosphogluconate dehydrogenase [candidate division WWE3 bacterium]
MQKQIGIIGLGKMGAGLAQQLSDKGWQVVGYNRSEDKTKSLSDVHGFVPTYSLNEFVTSLPAPRIIWLMVSAGSAVDETIEQLTALLKPGDTIIDGGNSYYKETIHRANTLTKKELRFLDAGVSGGPAGARNGACLMVGGLQDVFDELEELFKDISVKNGYAFFEGYGAGHFVKMVHNAIEYGMMQSIAEGFDIMRSVPDYKLDLLNVTSIYNHGSVIESRLTQWMEEAFQSFGTDLETIPGSAGQGGGGAGQVGNSEAEWTHQTAQELGIRDRVIAESLDARQYSRETPNYQGKIINALRNMFGGHSVTHPE